MNHGITYDKKLANGSKRQVVRAYVNPSDWKITENFNSYDQNFWIGKALNPISNRKV